MAENTQASSDNRLTQINQELSQILEERLEFLTKTLSETQRFSQKIANTELEIQRNSAQHARLDIERQQLEKDVGALSERVDDAGKLRDEQQQLKYDKEKELQRLEWEIADLRKGNEEANGRIKSMETEQENLTKENEKLHSRISVLEEGVAKVQRLREEYLARIAGLDSEMKAATETSE
jgi:chromosome segregation ATPase